MQNSLPFFPSPSLPFPLQWRLVSPLQQSPLSTLKSSQLSTPTLLPPLLLSLPFASFRSLFTLYLHSPSFPSFSFPPFTLLKSMQSSFGIKPDTFCYNAVIRMSEPGEGFLLYREMVKDGVLPNVVTYVSLVKGLARVGRIESARELICEMGLYDCKPNVVVYTAFLDGLCEFGDWGLVMEVLGEMEGNLGRESEPNVVTCMCLMKCLCENSRFDEELSVLDRMVRRGVKVNRVFVRTVLKGFCGDECGEEMKGRIDEAMAKDPMEIY